MVLREWFWTFVQSKEKYFVSKNNIVYDDSHLCYAKNEFPIRPGSVGEVIIEKADEKV
jgi:hypothetical protein